MTGIKKWDLKGKFYETCRAADGHCALWFGGDMPKPCATLVTYLIEDGQIENVDMKGIIITIHMDGIGPKHSEIALNGVKEGAAYVSENATDEQRELLEPFIMENLDGRMWRKSLGIKFVAIKISEEKGIYNIVMPFGEQKLTLTTGADEKSPIRMENSMLPFLSNIKFCNTDFWKYNDYGKKLEYHKTSGVIANFALQEE